MMFAVTVLTEDQGPVNTWLSPFRVVSVSETLRGTVIYYYVHDPIPSTGTRFKNIITGEVLTEAATSGIANLLVRESGPEVLERMKQCDREAWSDDDG